MFKFMLCALDVGTHALHVVMQRILLRLRETVDQKTLHTLPVRFEIGDDGVALSVSTMRLHRASCATDHGQSALSSPSAPARGMPWNG